MANIQNLLEKFVMVKSAIRANKNQLNTMQYVQELEKVNDAKTLIDACMLLSLKPKTARRISAIAEYANSANTELNKLVETHCESSAINSADYR